MILLTTARPHAREFELLITTRESPGEPRRPVLAMG
jgi:hypothetical protein